MQVARLEVGAERAVDLLYALSEHLPATVGLSIECFRSKRLFTGTGLELSEVREAIARLKVPLVASGGVELSLFGDDDQLALGPLLDLWIYARSDRWSYLLDGRGVQEVEELTPRGWSIGREDFEGGAELIEAITAAAERLTLRLA